SIGWLPGAVIFPWVIDYLSGPVNVSVYLHFGLSFVTSWLVALTNSYFLLELLLIVSLYVKLWAPESSLLAAEKELHPVKRRLKIFQILAGAIPLFGAIMIVTSGSGEMSSAHFRVFQVMIIALIILALCGFLF